MNEDRKKRGLANSNLLIAMAITALIIGSSNAMANQTASGSSYKVTEQMQIQTVTGVVVDANGEPIIGASVVEKGTTNGIVNRHGWQIFTKCKSRYHSANHICRIPTARCESN